MVNVGKYTSPMDPMGKDVPIISKYEGGFADQKKNITKKWGGKFTCILWRMVASFLANNTFFLHKKPSWWFQPI